VVLRVAVSGNPRLCPVCAELPRVVVLLVLELSAAEPVVAVEPPFELVLVRCPLEPPPHPAAITASRAQTIATDARSRIARPR
jgi:hypothetical protein